MKVILNKDFSTLGEEGDVVEVKSGYARNYLLPQNIAVLNTKSNQSYFKAKAGAIEKRKEEKRLAARSLKEKLASYEIKVVLPTGDNGRLFGSVTSVMIQDILQKDGIEIERKRIEVPSHAIKTVGTYTFNIALYGGEDVSVKLIVEAEPKKESSKEVKKPRHQKAEEKVSEAQEEQKEAEEAKASEESAPVEESTTQEEVATSEEPTDSTEA